MKQHKHPRKTTRNIIFVAAALCLCIILCTVFSFLSRLDDALTRASDAEHLVDTYKAEVAEMHEANESLQKLNDELRATNEKLQEALDLFDYDFSVAPPAPPQYLDVPVDEDLQSYIWSLCCLYDIEDRYELIYAIIRKESTFNSSAISSTGDYGLMQINKCNHKSLSQRLGITDFLDPYQNVHAGIYMIANLLHRYSVEDALMAYNMGSGGASKLWDRGIHSTSYTDTVLDYYRQFTEDI